MELAAVGRTTTLKLTAPGRSRFTRARGRCRYVYDGSSLHDKMVELARAGVSPMSVLQAATRNVARVAGAADWLGTVSVGKVADLVILDEDPLADIANIRRIHAVVRGGRLFDRRDLDSMLR